MRARPTSASLAALWDATCKAAPHALAVLEADSGVQLTRDQLHDAATALARGPLRFAAGQRVAFALPNGAEWLANFLALQQVRACAIPLDGALSPELQRSAARALGARFIHVPLGLEEICPEAKPVRSRVVGKVTSGSSGQPALVLCRADHLAADGDNIWRTMGLLPSDRNLALIPFGHSYGLGNLVLPLLQHGCPLITAQRYLPSQIPKWIEAHGATVFPTVPDVLRLLTAWPGGSNLRPLRLVLSAGARLPAEVAAAFTERFGLPVHNFYGSSETGGICYDRTGTAAAEGRAVGTPMEGVQVSLRRGRVHVAGPAVALAGGDFIMPDLAEWNASGELILTGRAGAIANVGGRKIDPRAVEARLAGLPGVTDAWVRVAHERGRDLLVAALESPRAEAELLAEFAREAPEWGLPRRVLVRPLLPRTARGKLDSAELWRTLDLTPAGGG